MQMTNIQPLPENADTGFWDAIAAKYAKGAVADMAGYEKTLKRIGELLSRDDQVLELGCGTGSSALRLAPLVGRYTATDLSPAMIAIARDKLADSPVDNLEFAAATAESILAPDQGYDTVIGLNYLHLVADLPQTLGSISALLKPGGKFITKTPCIGEMNVFIRMAIPLMRLVGKAPANIQPFDREELVDALENAGFAVELVEWHASKGKGKGKDRRPFILAHKV